ncbi:MAG: PEP-CTERM sorting domain-containing protein [Burkholderiaceae bacterium]
MKNHLVKAGLQSILAALLLSIGASASATLVSGTQNQTVNGQNFVFALGTPGYAANTASKLTVSVQGDFDSSVITNPENFTVFIEGINFGTFGYASPQAYNIIDYRTGTSNLNALAFSVDFLLDGASTNGFLANGNIDVVVDFSNDVTTDCGWSNTSNCVTNSGTAPFAKVSFDYQTNAVSEPLPIALMGIGLLGVALSRRRNKKQA